MVYPPGLEFLFAHFGCLLAGCVAVPVYPPDPNGSRTKVGVEKLALIAKDCDAKIVLTSYGYNKVTMSSRSDPLSECNWPKIEWNITTKLACDKNHRFKDFDICPDDLAFLQYTSGSTSDPKGVMILHRNYLHNVLYIAQAISPSGSAVKYLTWLPQYHGRYALHIVLCDIF